MIFNCARCRYISCKLIELHSRHLSFINNAMDNTKTLKEIFKASVEAVRPANILNNNVFYRKEDDILQVFGRNFPLKKRNIYIVGAGKCVLEMGITMENILNDKVKSGILSVPCGILAQYNVKSNRIQYIEGARNNLPDEQSSRAAKAIEKLVTDLDENCLLIVLLSGGGSALLPSPRPPITLEEKCKVINDLGKSGASIVELNTVRKQLSTLKGGKLAELSHPAEIISFLICDVIGNRYDFIASGPTYLTKTHPSAAKRIIRKYNLENNLPDSIEKVLNYEEHLSSSEKQININNFILCDNNVAIESASEKAKALGYKTFILSNIIEGDINSISHNYIELLINFIKLLRKSISFEMFHSNMKHNITIHSKNFYATLKSSIELNELNSPICIIAAGEPTIKVTGKGKGGRNQQLALQFAVDLQTEMERCPDLLNYEISFLSAGTDGIDGPTDAAGAISYENMKSDAEKNNMLTEKYLENNDSYSFFEMFDKGRFHVKTGHTNTNVMDIHIILIREKK